MSNGQKKTILNASVGQLGFKNSKKNLFTSAWLLGKKTGQFLQKQNGWMGSEKWMYIHNASSNNYRLKSVIRGFKDYKILFNKFFFVSKISFNGCKKKNLGRTGRKRKIFFS
jgi:hypothetical protein